MDREHLALENFDAGKNCAQAVVGAYADILALPVETAYAIACGFGAGMGQMQETCGAVTGAFMVLGYDSYGKQTGDQAQKNSAYSRVQEFSMRFKKIRGTTDCKKLLNIDLSSANGQLLMQEHNLREFVCKNCIKDAVQIIDEMLGH